jgi:hypothetical protein
MSKIRFASEEYVDSKLAGAATVQPDWAQNDAAASDYVKNRTHWIEGGSENIVLFDGELTNFSNMGSGFSPAYEAEISDNGLIDDFFFLNAVSCIITYNNTVYTDCVIEKEEDSMYLTHQTTPRFGCWFFNGGPHSFVHYEDIDPLPLKVEVTVSSETYHPLSENFIPDTIARKTDVEAAINAAIGNVIGGSY